MKTRTWLARDKEQGGNYALFTGPKPKLKFGMWEVVNVGGSVFLKEMCSREFHKFCKIRLRKGRCVAVKVTYLENGFKFEVKQQ